MSALSYVNLQCRLVTVRLIKAAFIECGTCQDVANTISEVGVGGAARLCSSTVCKHQLVLSARAVCLYQLVVNL